MFDNLNKKKSEYLKKVLNSLNPIISKYVEENEISLVLQKNNIIVAKKELDITNKILDLLNEQIKEIKF
jgi:outer membrane protein